jgi:hypothetical protein
MRCAAPCVWKGSIGAPVFYNQKKETLLEVWTNDDETN